MVAVLGVDSWVVELNQKHAYVSGGLGQQWSNGVSVEKEIMKSRL